MKNYISLETLVNLCLSHWNNEQLFDDQVLVLKSEFGSLTRLISTLNFREVKSGTTIEKFQLGIQHLRWITK